MLTSARARLWRDFKRLQQDPPEGIGGAPQDNNIMLWNAFIFGPDDTPWDGGTFKLTLQFTEDYPNKPPPTVRFVSRMFHPNSLVLVGVGLRHGTKIHFLMFKLNSSLCGWTCLLGYSTKSVEPYI